MLNHDNNFIARPSIDANCIRVAYLRKMKIGIEFINPTDEVVLFYRFIMPEVLIC